jgi:hypothetical protein
MRPPAKTRLRHRRGASRTRASLAGLCIVLLALVVAPDGALATHATPVGASPSRVSLVPAFAQCTASNSTHGPPYSLSSCNPPQLRSTTVGFGPNSIGFVRIVVCPQGTTGSFCTAPGSQMPLPDVRITGSIRDITCRQTGVPSGCVAGSDYNPNTAAGPYSDTGNGTSGAQPGCFPVPMQICTASSEVVLSFALDRPASTTASLGAVFTGHGVRVTDHHNCNPSVSGDCPANPATSNRPATLADIQYPIPLDCLATASTTQGSTCGTNTTSNALVPGAVLNGKGAVYEGGQLQLKDAGADGALFTADDQVFAVEGIFAP